MSQTFTYAPLQESEIRLLKILPGEENEQIAVTIEHVSLESLPSSIRYTELYLELGFRKYGH